MTDTAYLQFGNNCDHLKDTPRFYAPHNVDYLPNFIQKAITRCEDFYFYSKAYLPNLTGEQLRRKRSERREAIALTLQALFNYMNISNGEVGFWTKNSKKLKSIHCEFLARKTGLKRQRLYRAIADLKKAGYLTAQHKKRYSPKGIYRTVKFFITAPCLRHLGFSDYYVHQMQKLKSQVARRDAPGGCDYVAEEIIEASPGVVKENMQKMKEMFSNLFATQRNHSTSVRDFTGCAQADFNAPAPIAPPILPPRHSNVLKRHKTIPEHCEQRRQQAGKMLTLIKEGLSMDEAKAKLGL